MFWKKKENKIEKLEKEISSLIELLTTHSRILRDLTDAVLSLDKRSKLQININEQLSKQIDILAQNTLLKDAKRAKEIAEARPTMLKEPGLTIT